MKKAPVDQETRVKKVPSDSEKFSVSSVERDCKSLKGEVNETRATPGWERVRVQAESGATGTVGPKETAKAFEMEYTVMSRRGVGYVAASGGSSEN